MAGIHGTAHKDKPTAQNTKPNWLTRMGPMRITVAPEAKLAKIAPKFENKFAPVPLVIPLNENLE
jgi:hypothetical protein